MGIEKKTTAENNDDESNVLHPLSFNIDRALHENSIAKVPCSEIISARPTAGNAGFGVAAPDEKLRQSTRAIALIPAPSAIIRCNSPAVEGNGL
jgi:hypothetical protein